MVPYILLLANTVVSVLGGLAVTVCFKGYWQHRSFSMLCLTIGFSLIAGASVIGAVLLSFSSLGFWEIESIQAVMMAIGFGYIVHSIFTKRR